MALRTCFCTLPTCAALWTESHTSREATLFGKYPVPREICARPELLRRVEEHPETGYATNTLPLLPFLCGKFARITSLATVAENSAYHGQVEILAVVPMTAFVDQIPLDVAIIFRFNKQKWGVLHNFARFDTSGLLGELISDDERVESW